MAEAAVHFFGVRHHGPGSARSLCRALEALEPDVVLLEGPPDAQGLVSLASHADMRPPVALLVYVPDDPRHAVFYPFATFSPEWQAIQYARAHAIELRFMDLPQAHRLALEAKSDPSATDDHPSVGPAEATNDSEGVVTETENGSVAMIRSDPLGQLAAAAGFSDGERWWDHLVETRLGGDAELFDAVSEAMAALREGLPPNDNPVERQREAFMRKTLRETMTGSFDRIAVVCGAWHVPALKQMPPAKDDQALLRGLPKVKTQAAWVPWSYDRLSYRSGYGAGIQSPAWYELLWETDPKTSGRSEGDPVSQWLTRVARLMREQDLDASSAHIIEAVRLAQALAALRGRPLAGLEELDEAALSVMCFGNEAPMALIRQKLVIGDRLGSLPADAPMAPLQQDLLALQKRLRLPAGAGEKDYDLDLRKPMDLERSHLLHRLNLLGVLWGERRDTGRHAKGTFHEHWRLQWKPEFAVDLVDAARLGNTVHDAATAKVIDASKHATDLRELAAQVDDALLADLPQAVEALMSAIQEKTAVGADVPQLMAVLPPLANVLRYGNVRKTDARIVQVVVDGLVARICIGLPAVCASLNDEAAAEIFQRIIQVDAAIVLLESQEHLQAWRSTLRQMGAPSGSHGLIAGRACRLLHDAGALSAEETTVRLSLALSTANDPAHSGNWMEGFLTGSGTVLIHDQGLWGVIDQWVSQLRTEHFTEVLPLLRRTFGTFPKPERRQMGQRVKSQRAANVGVPSPSDEEIDHARAAVVLPLLAAILGGETKP